jgi:hypothetical protein
LWTTKDLVKEGKSARRPKQCNPFRKETAPTRNKAKQKRKKSHQPNQEKNITRAITSLYHANNDEGNQNEV